MSIFPSTFYFTAPPELNGRAVSDIVGYQLANIDGAVDALQEVSRNGDIYSICVVDGYTTLSVSLAGKN